MNEIKIVFIFGFLSVCKSYPTANLGVSIVELSEN